MPENFRPVQLHHPGERGVGGHLQGGLGDAASQEYSQVHRKQRVKSARLYASVPSVRFNEINRNFH